MDIRVDSDGLRADGVDLCASGEALGASQHCEPAAADPVSTGWASWLSTSAAAVQALMDHAAQLRVAGGMSLTNTTTILSSTDECNAATIAAVTASGRAPLAHEPTAAQGCVPDTPAPSLPVPPALLPPAAMTGEEVAALVHTGPGPQGLRSFADTLRSNVASQIQKAATESRNQADSITAHWADGHQQASHNVAEHAAWLDDDLHSHVLRLADSADSAAEQAQTLIDNTPRPEHFTELHNRLNAAVANWRASGGTNAAPVLAVSQQLAKAHAHSVAGYQRYWAAASTSSTTAPPLPSPAPPIVKGGQAQTKQPHTGSPQHHPQKDDEVGAGGGSGDEQNGASPTKDAPGTAPSAPPPSGSPAGFPQEQSPANPTTSGAAANANIAGTLLGAGMGSVGQLANGLQSTLSGGGSPLSALSGLSSLPGLSGFPSPEMPHIPSDLGQGLDPGSDPSAGGEGFGSGGTSPSGGADAAGVGGGPVSSSMPALSSANAGPPAAPSTVTPASPPGPSAGGGMGMIPPMMGGKGPDQDDGRSKYAREDQRAVLRPVANTEPVFGEVERTRPSKRRAQEGESS